MDPQLRVGGDLDSGVGGVSTEAEEFKICARFKMPGGVEEDGLHKLMQLGAASEDWSELVSAITLYLSHSDRSPAQRRGAGGMLESSGEWMLEQQKAKLAGSPKCPHTLWILCYIGSK